MAPPVRQRSGTSPAAADRWPRRVGGDEPFRSVPALTRPEVVF